MADPTRTPLQRGIAALRNVLGQDATEALLQPAPMRADEAASFYFPLPIDYTGRERKLRIGFPVNFPRGLLRLNVEPSPWLVWPHASKSGLCLHGFQERPITGTPEIVVADSLARLAKVVSLSEIGSSQATRDIEFQNEITTYWSFQHGHSLQNLILLDRPQAASELFALSDPRRALPSGQETVWLASDVATLKGHYRRIVGRSAIIRAADTPGFYVKLQSYPDIRAPGPEELLPWLTPHLTPDDVTQLVAWFDLHGSLASRWIVLELPGVAGAPTYCLNVRSFGVQRERGAKFGLRTARRRPAVANANIPALVRATALDVLDRASILSRDISGTAKQLESARVVCVGVGSLGSVVAMQLARSGVGHLTLIDPDTLVSANLGRHVLGADSLGRLKAKALRDKILRDLPTTECTAYPTYLEVVMSGNPEVFDTADLVVITTADWQSEVTVWRAKSDGAVWRLLQAWSEPHSQVGHALLAPAGPFDGRHLFTDNGDFRHKFTEWPGGGVIPLPACGESFIPGGSLGMTNIASMVSDTALRALAGRIENATWVSSIYRPDEVPTLGGKYYGPKLPDGAQQISLERGWPEHKDEML